MTHMKEHSGEYSKICNMRKTLCCWVEDQIAMGPQSVDANELGAAIDMIKDLSEAEKNCYEACYYHSVVEAMEEYGENPRMGYNPNRIRMNSYEDGYKNQPYSLMMHEDDEGYGKEFSRYRKAKRHYTETHSESEKNKMKEHANHHIMEAIGTLKEIWKEADPELRQKMKNDMSKLMGEMN